MKGNASLSRASVQIREGCRKKSYRGNLTLFANPERAPDSVGAARLIGKVPSTQKI
jgi:hypothetical protein